MERILLANLADAQTFQAAVGKGRAVDGAIARYLDQIMFNPDPASRAAAIAQVQGELIDHYATAVQPSAYKLGTRLAANVVKSLPPAERTLDNPQTRQRVLYELDLKANTRLRVVEALVGDKTNTLQNRLTAYWLEPGAGNDEKLAHLRRIHDDMETRRRDYAKRLDAYNAGDAPRRPAEPRLDYVSRLNVGVKSDFMAQARRAGTEAETAHFVANGFQTLAWVTVNASQACPDCKKRQGTKGDEKFWDSLGRPGSGKTVCGHFCFCMLVPAQTLTYHPGLNQGLDTRPGGVTSPADAAKLAAVKATPAATPTETPAQMVARQTREWGQGEGGQRRAAVVESRNKISAELATLNGQAEKLMKRSNFHAAKIDNILAMPAGPIREARRDDWRRISKEIDAELDPILNRVNELASGANARKQWVEALAVDPSKRVKEWTIRKPETLAFMASDPVVKGRIEGDPVANGLLDARDFLRPMLASPAAAGGRDKVEIEIIRFPQPGGRAFHRGSLRGADDGANQIALDVTDGPAIAVHEMGHELEQRIPGAQNALNAFIDHRTKGQKPEKLAKLFPGHGFTDNEYGRDDDFGKTFGDEGPHKWYVGKDYGGRNTEVLSMTLERMFHNAPDVAEKDPELFDFVTGILHGKIKLP